jgi:hypothetical protein
VNLRTHDVKEIVDRTDLDLNARMKSVLSVSLHKRKKVNFFRQGRGGDAMPL